MEIGGSGGFCLSCFFGGDCCAPRVELLEDLFIDRLPGVLNSIKLRLKLGLALRDFGILASDLRFIFYAGSTNKRSGERFGELDRRRTRRARDCRLGHILSPSKRLSERAVDATNPLTYRR